MSATHSSNAPPGGSRLGALLRLLAADKFVLAGAIFLFLLLLMVLLGPLFLGQQGLQMNLRARNLAPFSLDQGWLYVLGGDTLGRPMVARLIAGAQKTLLISLSAVAASAFAGAFIGLVAGYVGGWVESIIMRLTDIVMSFPAMLLALLILFMLGPSVVNLVVILAITRLPLYIRTTRAEVMEVRLRVFVRASELMGASTWHVLFRHILPVILPTVLTIATIDFANVVLIESSLSFLGLGIQPPEFTWGAMVAAGRSYLGSAWWLAFWPGLMILLTTISLNLVGNWVRALNDPRQRMLMEVGGKQDD